MTSGTWTALKNQPPFGPGSVFLLTDGTVLAQDGGAADWWKLTPDNTGSYINGTWSQAASMGNCGGSAYAPLYYGSAVLPDGRLVVIGGEYNNYSAVWTNQGAIYDPIVNHWTCVAPPSGWSQIGDAESVVLPDGTFMIAQAVGYQVATLNADANPPTFNSPFTPAGKSADGGGYNDEEGWTLLPDGTVLTLEVWNSLDGSETPTLAYSPFSETWNSAGIAPDPLVLLGGYFEVGPAVLRPDGTVFASGGTGFNDIYDSNDGTWTSGPSFPTITNAGCSTTTQQLKAADAPAALLPNGNVLVAAGPTCGGSESWGTPTDFFEFDGTNLTQVSEPTYGPYVPSYQGRLLPLPTGQVMYTNFYNYVQVYTPVGTPNASWAPTITTSPAEISPGGANYQLAGTQFNGLSGAVGYGDDYQAATNYPLVTITNNATGHVFYARTHGHSTMAVATGSETVSTEFDVPGNVEDGLSTLVVIANGIASQPVSVNVSGTAPTPTPTSSPTPTATLTKTATPTKTATATRTATPTATRTATATATKTVTATATATPIPTPVASLSSSGLNFNSQPVGKTNTKNINLNNSGKASLTIANITTSGDFSQTNNCGASLGAGKNCTIAVTFLPTAGGSRTGILSVSDNAGGSPQTASLSGIGTNALKISSNNLSFGTIKVGTTSAPQSVTVTNNQSVSAGLSAVIGGTNPGDFAISPSSTCGAMLAAKNSCVYAVTFEPVAKNARNATLSISDSPDPTSPYVVKLSGNGG